MTTPLLPTGTVTDTGMGIPERYYRVALTPQ